VLLGGFLEGLVMAEWSLEVFWKVWSWLSGLGGFSGRSGHDSVVSGGFLEGFVFLLTNVPVNEELLTCRQNFALYADMLFCYDQVLTQLRMSFCSDGDCLIHTFAKNFEIPNDLKMIYCIMVRVNYTIMHFYHQEKA